jgi:hypothetical protein
MISEGEKSPEMRNEHGSHLNLSSSELLAPC